ncbi:hypothetical protein AAFF_G00439460, partial [Aldrovandia affinis]
FNAQRERKGTTLCVQDFKTGRRSDPVVSSRTHRTRRRTRRQARLILRKRMKTLQEALTAMMMMRMMTMTTTMMMMTNQTDPAAHPQTAVTQTLTSPAHRRRGLCRTVW